MEVDAGEADGHYELTKSKRTAQNHKRPLKIVHEHEAEEGGLCCVSAREGLIGFYGSEVEGSTILGLVVLVVRPFGAWPIKVPLEKRRTCKYRQNINKVVCHIEKSREVKISLELLLGR